VTNELWELALSSTPTWGLLAPAGTPPAARYAESAIYDPVGDRMVMFGGSPGGAPLFTDTWELTLGAGPAWHVLAPTGTPPIGRDGCGVGYDPQRQRMIVFGGVANSGYGVNDLNVLSLKYAPGWVRLTPHGINPGGRSRLPAVYDFDHERFVVYDGVGGIGDAYAVYFNGGYSLDLSIDAPARGSVTKNLARSCYPANESVTLTATATSGNRFMRWLGDASGSTNPLTFVMDGHKTITAQFVATTAGVEAPPGAFELSAVVPNPSFAGARIDFAVAAEDHVRLTVLDIAGREIARLSDGMLAPGRYSVVWDGRYSGHGRAGAGVYFVRYHAGGRTFVRRLVKMR
jgi:hypothetical protein